MKFFHPLNPLLCLALLLAGSMRGQAQWVTQPLSLKAGWNAVYLHVDPSYDTLDSLVGSDVSNPIEEIWMWTPSPTAAQFVTSPLSPSQPTYWLNWVRVSAPSATLSRLRGNVACLVRSTADYTWNLKGKAIGPSYQWSGSGLNFIGFPTLPGGAAPTFDTFLTPVPDLKVGAEVFRYQGGAITDNPVPVFDFATTRVRRGEAFWMRSTTFNRYFGPFDALFGSSGGVDFDDSSGQFSFRVRNRTKANLTVKLEMIPSETRPAGQPDIAGMPPVLVRGPIRLTDLTYPYTALSSPVTIVLKPDGQPGSDAEVVLGLNRFAMSFPAGSLVAGVLRMTDSLNYSQIDVPVTAKMASTAGLWIGDAEVRRVNQYLTTYHTAESEAAMNALLTTLGLLPAPVGVSYARDAASKRIIKFTGTSGSYLVKNVNTDSGAVIRPYPLRLILHNNPTGAARLLQRAFVGLNTAGDQIVCTKESFLDPKELASARRITAAHLPFTAANDGWPFSGPLGMTANITATAAVSHDDQASNPFLHTYHPDHDNLDAQFGAPLPVGDESYGVSRLFRLVVSPPADHFASLTAAGTQFSGQYTETITLTGKGGFTRNFDVSGAFTLNRISTTPTLTK